MLLMIGYLTTPAATTGVTLSEFWAWVRYLAAITPGDAEMKLTHSFAELDAHQKTSDLVSLLRSKVRAAVIDKKPYLESL